MTGKGSQPGVVKSSGPALHFLMCTEQAELAGSTIPSERIKIKVRAHSIQTSRSLYGVNQGVCSKSKLVILIVLAKVGPA